MQNLKHFQQTFISAIHGGRFEATLFEKARSAGSLDAMGVFSTYHLDYSARLTSALQSTFPVVCHCLGKHEKNILNAYIQTHPSQHQDLSQLGVFFSSFLSRHPILGNLPYLAELAKLEWSFEQCFHAIQPYQEELTLENVSPEQFRSLRFYLVEHQMLLVNYPVYDIWNNYYLERPVGPGNIKPYRSTQGILIGKTIKGVRAISLRSLAVQIIEPLRAHQPLEKAVEGICEENIHLALTEIQDLFLRLRQHNFLQEIKTHI